MPKNVIAPTNEMANFPLLPARTDNESVVKQVLIRGLNNGIDDNSPNAGSSFKQIFNCCCVSAAETKFTRTS